MQKKIFRYDMSQLQVNKLSIICICTCPLSQEHVTIDGIDLLNSTPSATFKPDEASTKNPSSHKSLLKID